jgi:hypothetical protein
MDKNISSRVDFLLESLWDVYGSLGRWDMVSGGLFGAKMMICDDRKMCADMDLLAAIARRHERDSYKYGG